MPIFQIKLGTVPSFHILSYRLPSFSRFPYIFLILFWQRESVKPILCRGLIYQAHLLKYRDLIYQTNQFICVKNVCLINQTPTQDELSPYG